MSLETASAGCVLLIDNLELRRESMRLLLEPWCAAISMDLKIGAPDSLLASPPARTRLTILVVGGDHLDDPVQQGLVTRVKEALPDVPCVVLSDSRAPQEAVCAASIGVQAFLSTAMQPATVNQVLAFVLAGGTYFPREALLASRSTPGHFSNASGRTGNAAQAGLTARQNEVLERLRYGKSNKVIARELNMQEATVKVHVRQIMRKLGASNRTQAALLAQSFARPDLAEPAKSALPDRFSVAAMPLQMEAGIVSATHS